MIQPIEVVGAIVMHGSAVLAAQRGPGTLLTGMWEFPGGKVEGDESPQQALRREIREELKCEVEVGAHVVTTSYAYEFGVVRLSTYYATLAAGWPTTTEHAELRWMPILDLLELNWTPADIPAVHAVMSRATEGR